LAATWQTTLAMEKMNMKVVATGLRTLKARLRDKSMQQRKEVDSSQVQSSQTSKRPVHQTKNTRDTQGMKLQDQEGYRATLVCS
jgi:hypothetical protein